MTEDERLEDPCGGCADCVDACLDACLDAGSITYTVTVEGTDDSSTGPTPLT